MIHFFLLACNSPSPSATQSNSVSSTTAIEQAPSLPEPENLKPLESPKIVLSGTVTYQGDAHGSIELEVLDNHLGKPRLMAQQTLEALGEFSIETPSQSEEVTIMAYLDLTGNRISDDDPRGYLVVTEPLSNQANLQLEILDLDALKKSKEGSPKEKSDPKPTE